MQVGFMSLCEPTDESIKDLFSRILSAEKNGDVFSRKCIVDSSDVECFVEKYKQTTLFDPSKNKRLVKNFTHRNFEAYAYDMTRGNSFFVTNNDKLVCAYAEWAYSYCRKKVTGMPWYLMRKC